MHGFQSASISYLLFIFTGVKERGYGIAEKAEQGWVFLMSVGGKALDIQIDIVMFDVVSIQTTANSLLAFYSLCASRSIKIIPLYSGMLNKTELSFSHGNDFISYKCLLSRSAVSPDLQQCRKGNYQ